MKKVALLLSLVLVLSVALVGCGGEQQLGEIDNLVVAQGADADSLDPHAANDSPSSKVKKQIYETLVTRDENMELQPGLAKSWEQIDELTYEFVLEEGVLFHNGEELTASDVEFTLRRALESPHVGHIVGAIDPEGFEIVDDYTIRISTEEPFAPILAHLSHTNAAILNEKAVEEFGDDYYRNPIGTGPYMFESWEQGDRIELVKFEEYRGEGAHIPRVTIRNISQNSNRTIELETGDVHIAYDIEPTDIDRIEADPNINLIRDPNLTTSYIGFNLLKDEFQDVKVRQAINYAIDVDTIINTVLEGSGQTATGPIAPNVWAANDNLEPYGHDVEKAKELLAEAGYEDGFETVIWTNDNQTRQDIAVMVRNQLEQIGIDARIESMEFGAYLDETAAGNHDLFILGWGTVTADPDYGLFPLFHSEQHGSAGNRTFYSNERVDELLEKGRTTDDEEVRMAAYTEVQEIIRDEAPWLFLNTGEERTGVNASLEGFVNDPTGHHPLWNVRVAE
ncbi:glutathione ABC transporter substrate-binding protein [Proteinivorax hydrogeniformans]|uniref:Glutathione ABC transporter substrate-binding protein n=1 Tax=Proteinivorax hydrogeniformans TaxID=1826727 RepID=A0AAU8HTM7_9FIRM